MLVSELLTEVKALVADCSGKDAEIIRIADRKLRLLVRKQIEVDQGYYNCEITLEPTDFKEVAAEVWDYRLPLWQSRIVEVAYRNASSDSGKLPYTFNTVDRKSNVVPYATKDTNQRGWEYSGTDTFRIRGNSSDLNLRLRIAKLPAKMGTFTLDYAFPGEKSFLMPVAFTLGTQEIADNSYMNTRFQVVTVASGVAGGPAGPRPILGAMRIGVGSDHNFVETAGNTRRTKVITDQPWPVALAVGDIMETVVELGDEHCDLLVLLVAQRLFQQRNNTDALRSISDDLRMEFDEFLRFIMPRQSQQPIVAKRSSVSSAEGPNDDPDRYHLRRRWSY